MPAAAKVKSDVVTDALRSFQDEEPQQAEFNIKELTQNEEELKDFTVTDDAESMKAVKDLLSDMQTKIANSEVFVPEKPSSAFNGQEEVRFPVKVQELDTLANNVYNAGVEIDADHPGFKDEEYRERRQELAQIAFNYKQGEKIPKVAYTANEIKAWRAVYDGLVNNTLPNFACKEYRKVLPLFQKHCGFRSDNIPQLQDISDFLKETTGFTIRPTAGMLTSRDFLASLAFRVFRCTQYIRHHSKPMFTPEPDACHEILGHVPLLADPDYAQFSQEFGLLSLGASDEVISKLASLYWYTIENGLCFEDGKVKIYGAALLSAPAEVEHCFSGKPKILPFNADTVAESKYPLTEQNWQYFVVDSFSDAKRSLLQWALPTRERLLRYNPSTQKIEYLDNVNTLKRFTHELNGDLLKIDGALSNLNLVQS